VAEAEEFALDATVAPARVLAGEAEDELVELGGSGAMSRWAAAVSRPLAADEIAVPAEECFGARQKGEPERKRGDAAEGREEDAIGGLPARTVDLMLEDIELVTEGEYLGAEARVGATVDDQNLEEEADDRVGQRAEHDQPTSQEVPEQGKGRWSRGDGQGLTAHLRRPT
jgi:hypothetical protein